MKKNLWLIVLKKLRNKKTYIALLLIGISLMFALLIVTPTSKSPHGFPEFSKESAPELEELATRRFYTFGDLESYFRDVAKKKGALYGFDVLRSAKLPPQTDLHLLAHAVGDVLYSQQGTEGIKYCTDEFRNACSHSIVVGSLLEKGENSLSSLSKICERAPGGSGAYTMCFHGLGHGVLAYNNYVLEKAIEMCKKTGTKERRNREYVECVGGAVMELVGGGDHDRVTYKKQYGKYIKDEDPLSPCDDAVIPDDVKFMCYTYITPNLFVKAGASLHNPNPNTFPKAFSFCDGVESRSDRLACYGGLGKEFVVLGNNRDVRSIDKMNNDQLNKVISWCQLAGNTDGINACLHAVIQSLFWGGESDPDISFRFCGLVKDKYSQNSCYEELSGTIATYIKDENRKKALCPRLPKENQNACNKT